MVPEPAPESTTAPAAAPDANASDRRRTWVARALVVLAVAGAVAIVASGVLERADDSSRDETPLAERDAAAPSLRRTERRRAPVPDDAVDVVVVSSDRQEPVGGVGIVLRATLRDDDGGGEGDEAESAGRTGGDGRVRLSGSLPGFVEVDSDAWDVPPPASPVVAVEGGREVRFEVTPRVRPRATLLDATTGLPLVDWQLSPPPAAAGQDVPRTDSRGVAAWPGLRRLPGVVAASDGRRRVHEFLLYAALSRSEVRLALPPAARTTRLRVVDVERRPIAGARAYVAVVESGVFVDADDRGEADLEYGARDAVPLVVTAPGRVPRRVELDGRPEVVVVLEASATRAFRLRRPDGSDVPAGTRLSGYALGPASYAQDGTGRRFGGTVGGAGAPAGVVTIDGLPAGAFEAFVEAKGPDVYAVLSVRAGADAATPIAVVAGPPRPVSLHVVRASGDGRGGEPVAGLLWLNGPLRDACDDGAARRAEIEAAVRAGRGDRATAAICARAGPDVAFVLPTSDRAVGVEALAPGGEYGCVAFAPQEAAAVKELRVAPTGSSPSESATVILVEWDDGAPAALVDLDVVRDDGSGAAGADARSAKPMRAMTDSSGAAVVAARDGRFVVRTTRPDGARFSGDGPLLLPSPSTPLVRLKPSR